MARQSRRRRKAKAVERWRLAEAAVYDTPRGRAVPIRWVELPDPTGQRSAAVLDLLLDGGRHAAARDT